MKKLGLCLSGGGARGPYQIGAVEALQELGIYDKIEVFSGASIGAANVSILASSSIENAKAIWDSMPKDPLKQVKTIKDKFDNKKLTIIEGGLRSMDFFEKLLIENLNIDHFDHRDVIISVSESGDEDKGLFDLIRSSFKHYINHESKSVYVDLKKIEREFVVDAVKASCSIPVVFSPVINDHKKYYDGGVFDNAPMSPLAEYGFDEIIFINISIIPQPQKNKLLQNVIIHEIKSHKGLGGILDFSVTHTNKLYSMGYNDTMNYFKNHQLKQ
jgi:NTE family protein